MTCPGGAVTPSVKSIFTQWWLGTRGMRKPTKLIKNCGLALLTTACYFLLLGSPVQADTIIATIATFDSSTDGWTADPANIELSWQVPGYLYGNQKKNEAEWYFVSPDLEGADWTDYIGETLTYDVYFIKQSNSPAILEADEVRIYSGPDDYIAYDSGYVPPGWGESWDFWRTFEVGLIAENFTIVGDKDFDEIMANPTALWLRAGYRDRQEEEGLDNVRIIPYHAPIPSTILLLGSGLVGLVAFRRKSKDQNS